MNLKQRLSCCNETILFPSCKSPNQVIFLEVWMPRIQNFCHSISHYRLCDYKTKSHNYKLDHGSTHERVPNNKTNKTGVAYRARLEIFISIATLNAFGMATNVGITR